MRRKEVRKRNEVMIELRKQRVSLEVRGRYVRHKCSKSRVCCLRRETLKSPWVCGSGCFGEKRECLQKMLPRGEVARCRSGIRHRSRHSQFWGWRKVVPVCGVLNPSNSHSAGIHTAAIEEQTVRRLYWTKLFSQKECLTAFPNYCCPERWFGRNRISHPDWVKLCVDPNGRIKLRAKQKCEIPFATGLMNCVCLWFGRPVFNPRSSYTKDLQKWYLMLPCLTLSIIK